MKYINWTMSWINNIPNYVKKNFEKNHVMIKVPICTSWYKAQLRPEHISADFYNTQDGSLVLEHHFDYSEAAIQTYADLPEGTYRVVVHNEEYPVAFATIEEVIVTHDYETLQLLGVMPERTMKVLA